MARRKRKERNVNRSMVATSPISLISVPAEIPAWHVAGAAVQGVSHARLDLPCQDAQGYRLLPGGVLLVALADGAGSARFSQQGADCAVEAALASLAAAFEGASLSDAVGWESRLRAAFRDAREAVVSLAALSEEEGVTPRDYASTLTCVAAAAGRLAVGQVGDGAVVAVDAAGGLFAVTRLQRGEYANETHFISETGALDQMQVDVNDIDLHALAVMSDGLIRLALKMPSQEPHAPFFQPLFRFAAGITASPDAPQQASAQLAEFLGSERVNARTDDDKSLVLAVREGVVLQTLVSQPPLAREDSLYTRESWGSDLPELDTMRTELIPLDEDASSSRDDTASDREGE